MYGLPTLVCVFTLASTRDMKQQQENLGFMSAIENRGCSKCLVIKLQKADLTFTDTLFSALLGENGRLRYHEQSDRVLKAVYKAFLDRVAHNFNAMLAHKSMVEISNDLPITRDRMARALMNADDRAQTITMEEHADLMNAQYTWLVRAVEVVRRSAAESVYLLPHLIEMRDNTIESCWRGRKAMRPKRV